MGVETRQLVGVSCRDSHREAELLHVRHLGVDQDQRPGKDPDVVMAVAVVEVDVPVLDLELIMGHLAQKEILRVVMNRLAQFQPMSTSWQNSLDMLCVRPSAVTNA